MTDIIFGALFIMFLRICDVTIGTFRTILVVQGKKYYAAMAGFCEVLIWIFAMRYIVDHMDQTINLFAYAAGFAMGNILGITFEEKVALGFVQINIISMKYADLIADTLRKSRYGVTILPGEGARGGVAVVVVIIKRREMKGIIKLIESIDPKCFITVQHSRPYRGFLHASRK